MPLDSSVTGDQKKISPNSNPLIYNESKASKRLKVATVAIQPGQDPDKNRGKLADLIHAIMQEDPDVELVFFGEMILGWYAPGDSAQYQEQISETIPGPTTNELSSIASKYQIFISFGISEFDGTAYHNSQVLLNPIGEIQAIHRKKNLKAREVTANYQPGQDRVTTTQIKEIRTGLVICSDTASPKTMWSLMRSRFELILHSLADDDQDDFVTLSQARLYDAWFVTANRHGQEGIQFWPGLITISDPLGKIRARKCDQEQFLIYEIPFADQGNLLKRFIRKLWVKLPLIAYILKNLKQAKSYL